MTTINGFVVHAILPNLTAHGIEDYVIAAQHPTRGNAVSARIASLEATEWFWGRYFESGTPVENLTRALAVMPGRLNPATAQALKIEETML